MARIKLIDKTIVEVKETSDELSNLMYEADGPAHITLVSVQEKIKLEKMNGEVSYIYEELYLIADKIISFKD